LFEPDDIGLGQIKQHPAFEFPERHYLCDGIYDFTMLGIAKPLLPLFWPLFLSILLIHKLFSTTYHLPLYSLLTPPLSQYTI